MDENGEDVSERAGAPPGVLERYYDRYMYSGVKTGRDQVVHEHHNHTCVVCLSPSHAALCAEQGGVARVDFRKVGGSDLSDASNKPSGKGKRGAVLIRPTMHVATVVTQRGASFRLLGAVEGRLVEVNERLLQEPHLLNDSPLEDGWLLIVIPHGARGSNCLVACTRAEDFVFTPPDPLDPGDEAEPSVTDADRNTSKDQE